MTGLGGPRRTCATDLDTHLQQSGCSTFVVPHLADLRALPALRSRLLGDIVTTNLELERMTFDQDDPLDRQLARLVLTLAGPWDEREP
jgi:hypothetical protein